MALAPYYPMTLPLDRIGKVWKFYGQQNKLSRLIIYSQR